MADDKNVKYSFRLKGIEINECHLMQTPQEVNLSNFSMNIALDARVDQAQKLIMVTTRVNIFTDDRKKQVGSFACLCAFEVDNFEEAVTLTEKKIFEIAQPLNDTLNSISLSTTRGAMFAEFKGTMLHFAFLPIIDVKALKKKETSVEF